MERAARRPTLNKLAILDEQGARSYVYPADVRGRYTRLKPWVFGALIAIYAVLPWLRIGGHPAILIDIPMRRFFLLGKAFNAQDVYLAFFVLSGIGFALIVLSALFGRIWCGWACPQTVFLEGVFRRVERWIEGPAAQRRALDKAPWTLDKLARKAAKHAIYLVLSFLVAHILLSYFVSMPDLLRMVRQRPAEHWVAFVWAFAMTGVIYFNFFWFREQLCLVICPYGRLQSALQDSDTIVIGYDQKRGEPRGKANDPGAGDCVDCGRCVAVCPTGIDIRNGLQLECVGCAQCIDACDEIMDKLGRPAGLIRYDSERGFLEGARRFARPRLFGYVAAGALGLAVASGAWLKHLPFEANVLRMPGLPYVLDGAEVRNHLLIHVINKNPVASDIEIQPVALPGVEVALPLRRLHLMPLAGQQVPVVVTVPRAQMRAHLHISLVVRDGASQTSKVLEAPLMGPTAGPAP